MEYIKQMLAQEFPFILQLCQGSYYRFLLVCYDYYIVIFHDSKELFKDSFEHYCFLIAQYYQSIR